MTDAAPTTHHERLLADVRNKIVSGVWAPGHRVPFETEMAASYGVSRMTMNKVLTQLTREGYLERRRKVGTVVAMPRLQSAIMTVSSIADEVATAEATYAFRTLSTQMRKASAQDRRALGAVKADTRIFAIEVLHFSDDAPFCHERRIINASAVPAVATADFDTAAVGAWLLTQIPWSAARHTIRAVTPDADVARLLKVRVSSACLQIERLTEFQSTPITFAQLTYPGARHQVVAQLAQ
jgi:GntR family histidine utilization transcriptional repressor